MIEHLTGNALDALKTIPAGTVQTCVTSPPYWRLRDYGEATLFEWPAVRWVPMIGCEPKIVPAWIGKLGDERSPEMFVAHLVAIFRHVREALTESGTLWVNLGDSYVANGGGAQGETNERRGRRFTAKVPKKTGHGIPHKNLAGIPWRLAFALQADGWILRSDIVWHKPNPQPESVKDRPTKGHEYFFLLAKSPDYYFDAAAIAEPMSEETLSRYRRAVDNSESYDPKKHKAPPPGANRSPMEILTKAAAGVVERGTRNKRTVWTVPTAAFSPAHFATMPPDLARPCILAGSKPGDIVLDPFGGSGTTGAVAVEHGRRAILIDPNPHFHAMIEQRAGAQQPGLL